MTAFLSSQKEVNHHYRILTPLEDHPRILAQDQYVENLENQVYHLEEH
jgi:hypothetical protein